ncbi:MAG TPA: hypothetical protein VHG34_04495, partial [Nitrososphaeraceae archaeon]|nr:hypothetical protein [Nitrososphaeraceae archaeon]
MTLKAKIYPIRRHPSLLKDIFKGKRWDYIEHKAITLDEKETSDYILHLKQTSPYYINPQDKPKLNRLCYIEDWKNEEIKETLSQLQKLNPQGFIHRKDWEWALGIVAMRRFGKLTKKSTAIGIGSGTEPIPFYLANNINHVYATDLYDAKDWKNFAPSD